MEDLIPLILQFASRLPKYRRVSKTWNNATNINIKLGYDINSYMNSKYPDWYNFLYLQLDTSRDVEFNHIWTLYINIMSYNQDWESMINCISYCNGNRDMIGKLLHCLYLNEKFDICNSMYRKLIKFKKYYIEYHSVITDYDIFMIYYMFIYQHEDRFMWLHKLISYASSITHSSSINIRILEKIDKYNDRHSNIFIINNLDISDLSKVSYGKSFCITFKYSEKYGALWTKEMIDKEYDILKKYGIKVLNFYHPILYYTYKDLWDPSIHDTTYYCINSNTVAINLAKGNPIDIDKLIK